MTPAAAAGVSIPAAAPVSVPGTAPAPAGALVAVPGTAPAVRVAPSCEEGRQQLVPDRPTALARLGASRAWASATGRGVVVAVIDTGVAAANVHFTDGVVLAGRSFAGGSPREDAVGHGTAVAGIVAARDIGPRSGLVGLAPSARILPVKVVPDDQAAAVPGSDPGTLAAGIRWAAEAGAQVIAVALSTSRDDPRLRDAVRDATAAGALVVASAGNRRTAEDAARGPRYPGAYPQAVAVAATDNDDRPTEDSVSGAHVDLAAPGRDVLTTFGAWGDCYLSQDGESASYATGYVAAAAALVVQRFPADGPARWKHRLEATGARERRDVREDRLGWGVVQPVEALTAVLDDGILGPVAPGARARPTTKAPAEPVALGVPADPGAPDRRAVLWVTVVGGGAVLALTLLRLARRGEPSRREPSR
ncbi:MAG: S8 family serine peptidase [Dermatophilaceae bacterium]